MKATNNNTDTLFMEIFVELLAIGISIYVYLLTSLKR